jgi:outer membrane protein OmpA-like peptidoglycan-associated protein
MPLNRSLPSLQWVSFICFSLGVAHVAWIDFWLAPRWYWGKQPLPQGQDSVGVRPTAAMAFPAVSAAPFALFPSAKPPVIKTEGENRGEERRFFPRATLIASSAAAVPVLAPAAAAIPSPSVTELARTSVHFKTGRHRMDQASVKGLHRLLSRLPKTKKWRISIEGHSDQRGPLAYNIRLSQQRARAVATFLRRHGIFSSKIHYEGLGPFLPLSSGNAPNDWALNRRVEVCVIAKE